MQGNVMHDQEHETGAAARSTLPPELSADEAARLQRGETIIREQTWSRGDRRYVGGLTYTVVDVGASELSAVLEDVDAYRRVLPKTKQARLVGMSGNDRLVEVVQGNALVQATYTMRVRSEPVAPSGQREVRFWLEPTLPHEIDDAWGFFRVEPFIGENGNPRVLLTYGVLVDVGAGIVRDLFEERVRSALLSVPQLVRRYVAEVRRSY
ncbi:hypothetical protein AKJ09_09130 [Labilithrix luteola]|uniref:Ribosome association toxin RatA n=1 Tax=Labilithrix luteola TaxID=1391654 RepID=A0A0K1Q9X1_9BACT|nr:hypothetical protein AKJ09_09130 [Labilithrix luteola]